MGIDASARSQTFWDFVYAMSSTNLGTHKYDKLTTVLSFSSYLLFLKGSSLTTILRSLGCKEKMMQNESRSVQDFVPLSRTSLISRDR